MKNTKEMRRAKKKTRWEIKKYIEDFRNRQPVSARWYGVKYKLKTRLKKQRFKD